MNAQLTGAAGVFHVAAELSMAGWVALPSIRNVQGADILVADPDGKRFVLIQVKTSKSKVTFWPVGKGALDWTGPNCYYAFVRRAGDCFEVFLEKASVIAREVEDGTKRSLERGNKPWALAWSISGQYATEGAEERARRQWDKLMRGPKGW